MIINDRRVTIGSGGTCPACPTFPTSCASGYHLVRFFDYDGTLLKAECIEDGEDVTAPDTPTHSSLDIVFDEWNQALTDITRPRDIGAIYETDDDKTHTHVKLTVATGKYVDIYFDKSDTSTLSIDWGDGSSVETSSAADEVDFDHTYANYGDYVIKAWISSGTGYYYIGNGRYYDSLLGAWVEPAFVGFFTASRNDMLKHIFIGDNARIHQAAFHQSRALETITIPHTGTMIFDSYAFKLARSLKAINIPNVQNLIPYACFQACQGLRTVTLPANITSFANYAFYRSYAIENLILPDSLTTPGSYGLTDLFNLRSIWSGGSLTTIPGYSLYQLNAVSTYVFTETTPPTMSSSTALQLINASAKIYVPDDYVATYKAATNWSNYEDYIYPMSEKGVTHDD